jgi:hypothetical protein
MARRYIVLQENGFPPRHPQLWKPRSSGQGVAQVPRRAEKRATRGPGRARGRRGATDQGAAGSRNGRIRFMCGNSHRVGHMPQHDCSQLFVLSKTCLDGKPGHGIRVASVQGCPPLSGRGRRGSAAGDVGPPGNRNTGLTTTGGERPVGPDPKRRHDASDPRSQSPAARTTPRGIFLCAGGSGASGAVVWGGSRPSRYTSRSCRRGARHPREERPDPDLIPR